MVSESSSWFGTSPAYVTTSVRSESCEHDARQIHDDRVLTANPKMQQAPVLDARDARDRERLRQPQSQRSRPTSSGHESATARAL